MNIIIFGSTGGTGKQLIKQALEKGYSVSAFARSPEKIILKHEKLKIIKGDVLDLQSVEKAIQNHNAVFCSIGLSSVMDKSNLRAKGTKNIIQAMQGSGINRLVCQSALGVSDSYNLLPFFYKFFIVPLFMKYLYSDHELQETYIKDSKLKWTIVRPAVLTNNELTGIYKHGIETENKSISAKISRADTADFMLKQVEDEAYLFKTPYVSY